MKYKTENKNSESKKAETAAKNNGQPHFAYYCNRECEFFPCHTISDPEFFNCLFCYCPLYALGDGCGGNFKYIEGGVKDCSACTIPHSSIGYAYITKKYPELMELAKRNHGSAE